MKPKRLSPQALRAIQTALRQSLSDWDARARYLTLVGTTPARIELAPDELANPALTGLVHAWRSTPNKIRTTTRAKPKAVIHTDLQIALLVARAVPNQHLAVYANLPKEFSVARGE